LGARGLDGLISSFLLNYIVAYFITSLMFAYFFTSLMYVCVFHNAQKHNKSMRHTNNHTNLRKFWINDFMQSITYSKQSVGNFLESLITKSAL
jgi:archaellum biogenesis protein FlaJ (TadC family)